MAKIEWFYMIITTIEHDDSEVLTSELFRTHDYALQMLKNGITDDPDTYGREHTEESIENYNEEQMAEIYLKGGERVQIRQVKLKTV